MIKGFLTSVLLLSVVAFGQIKDAHLWTGLKVGLDITEDISVDYETQTRFYKNASVLQNYYNELGVKYSPFKRFEIGAKYRIARKNREDYFANENRYNIDVEYGYKIKPVELEFTGRLRYQHAFSRLGVVNDEIYPRQKHTGRFKVKVAYEEFKRIVPSFDYEVFTALQPKNPISELDAYRITLALEIDLPMRLEVDVKYRFERENRSELENNHIYMIQLSYSFKDPIFESKKDEGH